MLGSNHFRHAILTLLVLGLGTTACTEPDSGSLPPEAFGAFEDTNDPFFQKRLDLSAQAVTYFISVSLPGVPSGDPTTCRSEVPDGLRPTMELTLDCSGTLIPFRFEYRTDREDWVVQEEDSAPLIFTRRVVGREP